MIFTHNNQLNIFIHIPKTGGNSIQKALIDNGRSIDKIILSGNQDGDERFELIGKYTKTKHMNLRDYRKYWSLKSMPVFVCVRNPFKRLLSLYYSPNKHKYILKIVQTLKQVP